MKQAIYCHRSHLFPPFSAINLVMTTIVVGFGMAATGSGLRDVRLRLPDNWKMFVRPCFAGTGSQVPMPPPTVQIGIFCPLRCSPKCMPPHCHPLPNLPPRFWDAPSPSPSRQPL